MTRYQKERASRLAYARKYYREHKTEILDKQKSRYDPDKARVRAYSWREKHSERWKEYMREYMRQRRANPSSPAS